LPKRARPPAGESDQTSVVAMLIVLYAIAPCMFVPPSVMLAIVIALAITFVISTIVLNDTARCERHHCHEERTRY